jgi:hypothetical protein
MSRRGRKRKPGIREAGTGDVRRPSSAERKRLAREKNLAECYVVAVQPHRRCFDDPLDIRAESAFGHFCYRHKLAREIYDAGCEYEQLIGRWSAIVGCPRLSVLVQEHGRGAEPSDRAVNDCKRRVDEIRKALTDLEFSLINAIIFDRAEISPRLAQVTINGLIELAKCFGKDLGKHPHVEGHERMLALAS